MKNRIDDLELDLLEVEKPRKRIKERIPEESRFLIRHLSEVDDFNNYVNSLKSDIRLLETLYQSEEPLKMIREDGKLYPKVKGSKDGMINATLIENRVRKSFKKAKEFLDMNMRFKVRKIEKILISSKSNQKNKVTETELHIRKTNLQYCARTFQKVILMYQKVKVDFADEIERIKKERYENLDDIVFTSDEEEEELKKKIPKPIKAKKPVRFEELESQENERKWYDPPPKPKKKKKVRVKKILFEEERKKKDSKKKKKKKKRKKNFRGLK